MTRPPRPLFFTGRGWKKKEARSDAGAHMRRTLLVRWGKGDEEARAAGTDLSEKEVESAGL